MGYRPITDFWWLARPKVSYHGAYPAGFVERARALLGVSIDDPVLHVCAGKVRDYPYLERAVGPNDGTIDLDPACQPDFLLDVRELGVAEGERFPWWRANVGAAPHNPPPWGSCDPLDADGAARLLAHPQYGWAAALVDRPYTEDDADEYVPGRDALPDPNDLLRRALSVVKPGGRVGMLDYFLPRPPKKIGDTPIKFVAAVAVLAGYGNRVRVFSVFERVAVNQLKVDRDRCARQIDQAEPEPTEVGAGAPEPAEASCTHPWHDNPALITPCPECGAGGQVPEAETLCGRCGHRWMEHDYRNGSCARCGEGCWGFMPEPALVEPTPEQHALVDRLVNKSICRACWLKRGLPEPTIREPDGPAKCAECGKRATVMPVAEAGASATSPATDAALDGF